MEKIDAMVDYIYTSPELDEEQRKYLKYEVTYENGQSIESRQNLRKQSSATIKVRIEYRSDIAESDLVVMPTSLSFNITLVYIQSDGSGVDVPTAGGNEPGTGSSANVTIVSGDGSQVGDEICIGEECFYVMSSTESTVTMLAKYNLHVGYVYDGNNLLLIENPTGKQDETAIGLNFENSTIKYPYIGVTQFSNDSQKGDNYNDYNGSIVEGYVNNYRDYLVIQDVTPIEARLITYDELVNLGCHDFSCQEAPSWVYSTSYWTESAAYNTDWAWAIFEYDAFSEVQCNYGYNFGVRPVITISKSVI